MKKKSTKKTRKSSARKMTKKTSPKKVKKTNKKSKPTKKTKQPKKVQKTRKVSKTPTKKVEEVSDVVVENTIQVELVELPEKTMRGKPKTKANMYFTQETQDAINDYKSTDNLREKNEIYETRIKYAFEKIAENVYNTYQFSYSDVSPLEVQKQAVSHMVANMDKYNSEKGKAFGYFSTMAKNWFIYNNNNTWKSFSKNTPITEQSGNEREFVVEPEHETTDSKVREFIKLMVEYWDKNLTKHFNKKRDLEIASAVVELFRNSERIDVFNKKALYLYIRDIADCQTQHITKVINRMKFTQKNIMAEYFANGVITGNHISIHL